MTALHQMTSEERAYEQLLDEQSESLSEAALEVLRGAYSVAYSYYMVHNISFGPPDAEEIMEIVYPLAADLTDHDCRRLARIWCAALAAAASVDPYDHETLVQHRVYRADLHGFYRMWSGLVEDVLESKKEADRQQEADRQNELAESEPPNYEDVPF